MNQFKSGFVTIAGRPNVGKSTLLNRILGTDISIATYKAQTTRDKILGIFTEENQGQIVFMDTPGIHRAKEGGVNEAMMAEVESALEEPDLIWYLVDPGSAPKHEEVVLKTILGRQTPIIMVFNKRDVKRCAFQKILRSEIESRGGNVIGSFDLSAQTGKGVNKLLDATWDALKEGPTYYPDAEQVSDRPMRFFVGEKVREQLFLCLGDELPYSCAVSVDSIKESAKPIRIQSTIHVERDSQKGMVVGSGGQKIREIGSRAREEIQTLMGQKVFLGLNVKVWKDWTRDAKRLKKMGYHLPSQEAKS